MFIHEVIEQNFKLNKIGLLSSGASLSSLSISLGSCVCLNVSNQIWFFSFDFDGTLQIRCLISTSFDSLLIPLFGLSFKKKKNSNTLCVICWSINNSRVVCDLILFFFVWHAYLRLCKDNFSGSLLLFVVFFALCLTYISI